MHRLASTLHHLTPTATATARTTTYNTADMSNAHQEQGISCVTSSQALAFDVEIMSAAYGYTSEQLMELAGLSCSQAIEALYPLTKNHAKSGRVLVVCGPGNNGGDGLVIARHLTLFGYSVDVVYPKPPKTEQMKRLLLTVGKFEVPVLEQMPVELNSYHLIVDAIFGFSFQIDASNGIREPYASIIRQMISVQSTIPIISVDVPSGWDVSSAAQAEGLLQPDCLISLSGPKECALAFKGKHHILGGRFSPRLILEKYHIHLPKYPGGQQWMEITGMKLIPAVKEVEGKKE